MTDFPLSLRGLPFSASTFPSSSRPSSLYSMVAIGSALAAGVVYVLFGPGGGGGGREESERQRQRRRRLRQRGHPPGMTNVKYFCFVNSTLQVSNISTCSTSTFRFYFDPPC